MKEYLKMSDAFGHALHDGSTLYTLKSKGFRRGEEIFVNDVCAVFCGHNDAASYAAHAINSHDELVAMNRELLSALETCRFDSLNMSIDDLCAIRSVMARAKGESQ